MKTKTWLAFWLSVAGGMAAGAPAPVRAASATASTDPAWQQCAALTHDREARLDCFDRWASGQTVDAARLSAPEPDAPRPAPSAQAPAALDIATAPAHDCRSREYSELSRFWELEAGTDCGIFGIRGYRPISLSWIAADSVNRQPRSPAPGRTAETALGYRSIETRIQLSVRTKIAQGLLTQQQPQRRDSLWFAYSQQSNWQIFSGALSRPFRTTDHEVELTYIYPSEAQLPLGWRLRYSGLSLVHQSNGQPLPLSRSWNRAMLMAGLEKGDRWQLQGRLWQRLNEGRNDDDNPEISNLIGRAELSTFWNVNQKHTLGATLRHSLRADTKGSVRLDWLRRLGGSSVPGSQNGLRWHTQLFSGYGDSLVDYNRRRTVLSMGLSLVDW